MKITPKDNNETELEKFDNVGIAAVTPILSTSDITDKDEKTRRTCDGLQDSRSRYRSRIQIS